MAVVLGGLGLLTARPNYVKSELLVKRYGSFVNAYLPKLILEVQVLQVHVCAQPWFCTGMSFTILW